MNKLNRCLLIVCLLLWACLAQAQQPAARVETVPFQSKLTGRALPYNVVLPPDYNEAKTTVYPVLYLLHGLSGHYDNWTAKTKLVQYAAQYRLIIVTPEGNDGWYTDSATVPADKYESYFIKELFPDVESRYRALSVREGRAIAGLSMGGYGSLKFGVKYPQMFVFAGSLSGALPAAEWTEKDFPGGRNAIRDTILSVYGPADSPVRPANDLFKLVRDLKPEQIKALPFLYADCGTEDFLFATNQKFANLLIEKRISHEYRQRPGAHNWLYWDAQVREILRLATTKMSPVQEAKPLPKSE
jgi:S-formylglutathione hydrolase FrmB